MSLETTLTQARLLPIASIFAPGALSVASILDSSVSMEHVPQIDFSNFNFLAGMSAFALRTGVDYEESTYAYYGPSLTLKRIALTVAMEQNILPIIPPYSNSSWTTVFNGPSLKCEAVDSEMMSHFQKNVALHMNKTDCYLPPTFLAWYSRLYKGSPSHGPYGPYGPYEWEEDNATSSLAFQSDTVMDTSLALESDLREQDAVLYIASMPDLIDKPQGEYCFDPGSVDNVLRLSTANLSMLQCRFHNSTYRATFNYINDVQDVNTSITELGSTLKIVPTVVADSSASCTTFYKFQGPNAPYKRCEYDPNLLTQLTYQSVFHAFTDFITGNVTIDSLYRLADTTRIRTTALSNTKELRYLKEFEDGIDKGFGYETVQAILANSSSTRSEPPSNQPLSQAMEVMFRNFTVSLMGSPLFQ